MQAPGDIADRLSGARCLVTGGAGFIGSNLTRALLSAGAEVVVLDNLLTGKRENLPEASALELVEGDVCDHPGLAGLVSEADFVFHLAAQVGNMKSIEETEEDARINVLGSVRLFRACRETGVKRVVYSSSSAIFGEAERLPIDEEHSQKPESFYALSKLTAERYALLESTLQRVPAVCLRYFNVYGSPMEPNEYAGVISIFFERLAAGKALTIFGDGRQFRDFVFVTDVVQANLLAALSGKSGRTYNIGSGTTTTITELARTMRELTGSAPEIRYEDFRAGEVRESVADIRRAREELGYAPAWSLRQGLAEMWREIAAGDLG